MKKRGFARSESRKRVTEENRERMTCLFYFLSLERTFNASFLHPLNLWEDRQDCGWLSRLHFTYAGIYFILLYSI